MTIETLGIDLGKTTCSIVGLADTGTVVFRRRVRRYSLLSFLSGLTPCVVAMEACGGAHHVARFCQTLGHEQYCMPSRRTWGTQNASPRRKDGRYRSG
jgi:transposase